MFGYRDHADGTASHRPSTIALLVRDITSEAALTAAGADIATEAVVTVADEDIVANNEPAW